LNTNSNILTIAGLDPSSGAGLTSDIKTFEAFGLYGLSVCTSVTVQNDIDFKASHWVKLDLIINQITTLFEQFKIDTVKIGIVENWEVLLTIVNKLIELNSEIKIILDPVLKASAGFDFHSNDSLSVLDQILEKVLVITPNYDEIKGLYPDKDITDTIEHISSKTNIYLKGGHRTDKKGWDELYHSKTVQCNIPPIADIIFDKHGSGCVLSSALAANLKAGFTLENAAFNAKKYIEEFLNSNESLLGVHQYNTINQTQCPNIKI
jgi:hydroxymethylpyrimidine/phosphomethylpyrimidine kinase